MTTMIYYQDAWFDLSDFETSGSFTVNGNSRIQSPNNTSDYIRFGNATGLEAYTIVLKAKWLANNSGANLLTVKLDTVNTTSAQGATISIGGSTNAGKIVAFRQFSNTTTTSTASLSPAVNDIITLTITKYATGYFDITAAIGTSAISLNVYLQPNAHKITIPATGNTFEIQSLKWYTPYQQFMPRMVMGDSITVGANASDVIHNSYAALIHAVRTAGLGDKTAEGVARLKDTTWRLLPKKVFVMLGTNDIGSGVADATWQANLNNISAQLTDAGIICVLVCPPPRNDYDMSVVRSWIVANYPLRYIDCYTPLLGSGTAMNAAYNSGDGVHPNDAGHALIANTILNHSLYT